MHEVAPHMCGRVGGPLLGGGAGGRSPGFIAFRYPNCTDVAMEPRQVQCSNRLHSINRLRLWGD